MTHPVVAERLATLHVDELRAIMKELRIVMAGPGLRPDLRAGYERLLPAVEAELQSRGIQQ